MTSAAHAAAADTLQPGSYQWLKRYPEKVDWHQKVTPAPLFELLDSLLKPPETLLKRRLLGLHPCAFHPLARPWAGIS